MDHVTSAMDFGASPQNENNITELNRAIQACRERKSKFLLIPPGIYKISDPQAIELRDKVMRGEYGINPEKKMFYPYAPYVKGLDFSDCNNLVVQANGVTILCDGWMEPVSLERCQNVSIEGLCIDYQRKPFSIGKVIKKGRFNFVVDIDPKYPIQDGVPTPRIEFWNVTDNILSKHSTWSIKRKLIGPQRLRIWGKPPKEKKEFLAMIIHSFHFRPAILILNSDNIRITNVTIHAQPGMGIVGHRSSNLLFKELSVLPAPGEYMSTNTDATHFTSCKGLITFDSCHIEGQGDDSTNIHNYYYTIVQKLDDSTIEIKVDAPTATHAQVLDYPDVNDTLELVEQDSLKPLKHLRVIAVKNYPEEWKSILNLDGKIPSDHCNYLLANITRLPQVIIRNCHFGWHLARGILIKTRNVLIENNFIDHTIGTGIHIGAEAFWYEGVGSSNVCVRNNKIVGCGGGNGTIDGASAIALTVSAKDNKAIGIHNQIKIENNQIQGFPSLIGIYISNAENVSISNNEINECKQDIQIKHSQKIWIQNQNISKIQVGNDVSDMKIE